MRVTLLVSIWLITILAAQSCFAQVCPHRKEPAFLAALQNVDEKTTELTELTNLRKRSWTSGYRLVTPNERVQFAIDYQDFLVSEGETGVVTDFYVVPVIPYASRVAFANRWWHTTDKTYSGRPPIDANWIHDALVDAGNSICLACQMVQPMKADRIKQNKLELDRVDSKK